MQPRPRRAPGACTPSRHAPCARAFQRDRDRIVHATAFRRLTYKTQVFVFHEGDHYRTRLTHSLEVAQIARAIARMLALDEDLAEALALAHDLGHPPFGHAGERALAAVMAPYGGFDHNAQSLKVVTRLERKYAAFDGLNLTSGDAGRPRQAQRPADRRARRRVLLQGDRRRPASTGRLHLVAYAPAEAQVAAIADDIAYNSHDLDDGLRAGLIGLDDLRRRAAGGRFVREAAARPVETQRVIYEVNRRMITAMIDDVVRESTRAPGGAREQSLAGRARRGRPVIGHLGAAARRDRRA